jgi:hypothetical protein
MTQAKREAPYSLIAILTLHDAVELFYGLVADQFHPSLDPKTAFDAYPRELNKVLPANQKIAAGRGIEKLNKVRVQLKHYGSLPSASQVADAVVDATTFLVANTLSVFGADYDTVSMVDTIEQPAARAKVRAARTANASGDRFEAMSLLVEVFQDLFDPEASGVAGNHAFQFGPQIGRPVNSHHLGYALVRLGERHGNPEGTIKDFAEQFEALVNTAAESRKALQIIAAGIDFASYRRFESLTPRVEWSWPGQQRWRHARVANYAPTQDDYEYCEDFVIRVAAKLAAVAAELPPNPTY